MPVDKVRRPPQRQQVSPHQVPTWESASRANDAITAQLGALSQHERNILVVDLVVGANRINHGLSAAARGATLTPTVADASFAWSFAASGDKQVVITVVGVNQPKAIVEVFR